MSYTVVVCDMFHFADAPDHEIAVPGFLTRDDAVEYARRRLRASLEDLREPEQPPEDLRHLWYAFGEDCRVVGPEGVVYLASSELDHFIQHPATPEERDYLAFYEAMLPEDFALVCEWAAGTVPPPHHYEYRVVLSRHEPPAGTEASEALSPRLQGEIVFWPDYPGSGVPVWRRVFPVWTREALRLYALLEDGGLFATTSPAPEGERPLGGEAVSLEVTAQGRTYRIRSAELPAPRREFLLGEVMAAVRALAPPRLWLDLEIRRRAYHHSDQAEG